MRRKTQGDSERHSQGKTEAEDHLPGLSSPPSPPPIEHMGKLSLGMVGLRGSGKQNCGKLPKGRGYGERDRLPPVTLLEEASGLGVISKVGRGWQR